MMMHGKAFRYGVFSVYFDRSVLFLSFLIYLYACITTRVIKDTAYEFKYGCYDFVDLIIC